MSTMLFLNTKIQYPVYGIVSYWSHELLPDGWALWHFEIKAIEYLEESKNKQKSPMKCGGILVNPGLTLQEKVVF